jgi:hypothetical protein
MLGSCAVQTNIPGSDPLSSNTYLGMPCKCLCGQSYRSTAHGHWSNQVPSLRGMRLTKGLISVGLRHLGSQRSGRVCASGLMGLVINSIACVFRMRATTVCLVLGALVCGKDSQQKCGHAFCASCPVIVWRIESHNRASDQGLLNLVAIQPRRYSSHSSRFRFAG